MFLTRFEPICMLVILNILSPVFNQEVNWLEDQSRCFNVNTNKVNDPQPCVFPFFYEGVSYDCCIHRPYQSRFYAWCGTVPIVSNDVGGQTWGYCSDAPVVPTPAPGTVAPVFNYNCPSVETTSTGVACKLPYYVDGQAKIQCEVGLPNSPNSGAFGCSVTSDYSSNGDSWRECNLNLKTVLPQAEGGESGPADNTDACVFPFIFDGVLYTACTNNNYGDGKYWCSTTTDYDVQQQWRQCKVTVEVCTVTQVNP